MSRVIRGTVHTLATVALLALSTSAGRSLPPEARPARSIDFFQEEITLSVTEGVARVHAVYHFRNGTDREIALPTIYPFHVCEHCRAPYEVSARAVDPPAESELPLAPVEGLDAVRLSLTLPANDVLQWEVDYEQKISGVHATYILTTTAAWGLPFEAATYRFVFPVSFENVEIWPQPGESKIEGETRTVVVSKADFLPTRDMTIRWTKPLD